MAVELVPAEAARKTLVRALGFTRAADAAVVRCEMLRAAAWSLTQGQHPVHVVRLLNHAVQPASFCADDSDVERVRSQLREALESLAEVGDVVEVGGGLWLPATTRLVDLRAEGFLLVGGVPARLLSAAARASIEHRGPYRHLGQRAPLEELGLVTESVDDWARAPTASRDELLEWGAELLRTDLDAYTAPKEADVFEFYAPEIAGARASQFHRWLTTHPGIGGRHVARRKRVFGFHEYRLAETVNGSVTMAGGLSADDARRLMYVADALAEKPVAAVCCERGGELEIVTASELPRPEQRILSTLGTVHVDELRRWERRWRFRGAAQRQAALERLRGLGMEIRTAPSGGRRA